MNTATSPKVVSREDWLAERLALLAREKELTRAQDELARQRRRLPWVRVDKTYVFDTPQGPRTLDRAVRRPAPAAGAALHARARLGRRLPELQLHGRPPRRHAAAPGAARRDAAGGVARAAGADRGLPPAYGLELPLGVVARQRLQPRLRRQLHARAEGAGHRALQLPAAALPARGGAGHQRLHAATTRARCSTPIRATAAVWKR